MSQLNCYLAFESTVLGGRFCCAVVYPTQGDITKCSKICNIMAG